MGYFFPLICAAACCPHAPFLPALTNSFSPIWLPKPSGLIDRGTGRVKDRKGKEKVFPISNSLFQFQAAAFGRTLSLSLTQCFFCRWNPPPRNQSQPNLNEPNLSGSSAKAHPPFAQNFSRTRAPFSGLMSCGEGMEFPLDWLLMRTGALSRMLRYRIAFPSFVEGCWVSGKKNKFFPRSSFSASLGSF